MSEMACKPVWVKKVISKKCDYYNKDICMTWQIANVAMGIGQVLEMLSNA